MLRRKPTTITLTSEDIVAYDDNRAADGHENRKPNTTTTTTAAAAKGDGKTDPSDELKPLPGDRPRVRGGMGSASGLGREERIAGR